MTKKKKPRNFNLPEELPFKPVEFEGKFFIHEMKQSISNTPSGSYPYHYYLLRDEGNIPYMVTPSSMRDLLMALCSGTVTMENGWITGRFIMFKTSQDNISIKVATKPVLEESTHGYYK